MDFFYQEEKFEEYITHCHLIICTKLCGQNEMRHKFSTLYPRNWQAW